MMAKKWLVIDAYTRFLPEEAVARAVSDGFDFSALMLKEHIILIKRTQDIEGTLRIMEDAGILIWQYLTKWYGAHKD